MRDYLILDIDSEEDFKWLEFCFLNFRRFFGASRYL